MEQTPFGGKSQRLNSLEKSKVRIVMEKNISLLILGNKFAHAGVSVLLHLNNPQFIIKDEQYDGLTTNEYILTVRHLAQYSVYSVATNRICSIGAMRDGSLVVAISIPHGSMLANTTPYDLLMKLYVKFLAECTGRRDDGRYEFKDTEYIPDSFKKILDNCQLKADKRKYYEMTGTQNAYVVTGNKEKTEIFLQDSYYPEFKEFSQVIVLNNDCPDLMKKLHLDIPKKKIYELYVNSQRCGKEDLTDENQHIFITLSKGHFYHDEDVEFSVSDIRKGKYLENPKISINDEEEYIKVLWTPKPKEYKCRLIINGKSCSDAENTEIAKYLTVCPSGVKKEIKLDEDGRFSLIGDERKPMPEIRLSSELTDKYSIEQPKEFEESDNEEILNCFIQPIKNHEVQVLPQTAASVKYVSIKLRANKREFAEKTLVVYAKDSKRKKVLFKDTIKLSKIRNGRDTCYEGVVYIGKESLFWSVSRCMLYIRNEEDMEETRIEKNGKNQEINLDKCEWRRLNSIPLRARRYLKVIPYCLVLIIGLFIGSFFWGDLFKKAESSNVTTSTEVVENTASKYIKLLQQVKIDSTLYTEVKNFYAENNAQLESLNSSIATELREQLKFADAYMKICTQFDKNEIGSIKITVVEEMLNFASPKQKDYLEKIKTQVEKEAAKAAKAAEAAKAAKAAEERANAYIVDLKGITIGFEELEKIKDFLQQSGKTLPDAIKEELSGRLTLYQKIAQSARKKRRKVEDMKSYVVDQYCSEAQREALYALYDHVEHVSIVYNYADEKPESIKTRNSINILFSSRDLKSMSDFKYIAKVANNLIIDDQYE